MSRDANLRRRYGITSVMYDLILAAQGGHCALCGRPPGKKALHVDHDHKTGLIRGLLCYRCNHRVIGNINDPAVFRRAAAYLENPPAPGVIGERQAPARRKRRSKI